MKIKRMLRNTFGKEFGDRADAASALKKEAPGKQSRWIAFTEDCEPVKRDHKRVPFTYMTNGWNGSYHEAWWAPFVACCGSTPGKACSRLRSVLQTGLVKPVRDQCVARFEARSQVRQGD